MEVRPEILAPAGDLQAVWSSMYAGANAVYFGLSDGFNARAKAAGIASKELREVVYRCHLANVKVYIALNILIFESELLAVKKLIQVCAQAGVDALIVQDPAVAILARQIAPSLEIHASTQMTISSPQAARFAQELGITRVVVPRELSVKEITKFAQESEIELEVFIHGALCVAWSGQCLSSEAWGGRSANRGQCAQACRMPYDLMVDGEYRALGDVKYLLSPKDLVGFRAMESLWQAGVRCFKIEGRYKGNAYVYQTVQSYQQWLDQIEQQKQESEASQEMLMHQMQNLSLTYSRGFSDGFLKGSDHQNLVEGRFPKHRGVFAGWVIEVNSHDCVIEQSGDGRIQSGGIALSTEELQTQQARIHRPNKDYTVPLPVLGGSSSHSSGPGMQGLSLRAGMGLVFDDGRPQEIEHGGRIFKVAALPRKSDDAIRYRIRLMNHHYMTGINVGQRVWVNRDDQIQKGMTWKEEPTIFARLALTIEVIGSVNEVLQCKASLWKRELIQVEVESAVVLQKAERQGLDEDMLRSKLCGFGQSPFYVQRLKINLADHLYLPVKFLKQMKRQLTQELIDTLYIKTPHQTTDPKIEDDSANVSISVKSPYKLESSSHISISSPSVCTATPKMNPTKLIPLCRTFEQLEAVIESEIDEIELDWMEFIGLRKAVERARAFGLKVGIATVRVQKPGESGYDRRIAKLAPDTVLIRHWGALMHFKDLPNIPELHGDFSLNLSNHISAQHVLDYGLNTVTASHDLDQTQLFDLLQHIDPTRLAVTLHHHIPTFHTEHCVYAHLLSQGKDFRNCGKPCEHHKVALRDHKGYEHPILVDVECRNTIFNAQAQTAASLALRLQKAHVGRLRIEFVWESREEAKKVIQSYQALLAGQLSVTQVKEQLNTHEQFGVSAGTMQVFR
jgi:U32 family peptidase